jgi:recombination protein RecT
MSELINPQTIVKAAMPNFLSIANQNKLVKWEEESQFAIQSLQKNAGLIECAAYTIQNAIVNIAAVGLTLNPADQYAYLVPEYNNQTKQKECNLRISFKGLIKNATDTGSIIWVKAEIVKENDKFQYSGPTTTPEHSMDPFSERGDSVGVYCIAKTAEGDVLVDIMKWDEVMKVKGCAKTSMVWNQWPEEMAKKAIIKRAAKQWPKTKKTSVLNKTISVMNESEGSDYIDPIEAVRATAEAIIEGIDSDDDLAITEAWRECTEQEQSTLWIAKSKGGFFDTKQKDSVRAALVNSAKTENEGEGTK